ncbi:glycosyl hydrolase [Carboxylicivirga caseinilyticus]|uniref:glycosyl hydrolase n=1 Tax=Carboxylicivirga caseinilyticus TaxID=3417572 RepID=UPI003D339167|nr:Ig-like domain-containing protein [Marinilabiliaceae bacterium A049]
MKKSLSFLLFMMLILSCSNDNNEEPKTPPVFKSSIPADQEENVEISTQIQVTFNEVVYLVDNYNITVNGVAADVTEAYTKIIINTSLLKGKEYTISIPKGSLINMDNVLLADDIEFSFSTVEGPATSIDENLVSANASTQAVNVYNFLRENYGSKCLSSVHANVSWNTNEAEWVNYHTGKYPAMTTVDYIHLPASPANWIDYSQTTFLEEWWNNNGLICANWHWIVPRYEGHANSNEFTYKPEETTFKASNVLIDGTWENTIAMADLEKLAGYLKLLQEKNIPLIWRPFHEAAGNTYEYTNGTAWFWWGYEGPDTYKALWQFMFNYFEDQGLNNLIWVWTTQTKDNAFYPGDEYVDIVGRDIYTNTDASDIASQYISIQETYPNKIITLSEMGGVSPISEQWSAGATWSYFMPWYDYDRTNVINSDAFYQTDHYHANITWWTDAVAQSFVITRDEMPDLK